MSQFPERQPQNPQQQSYDPGDYNFSPGTPASYENYDFGVHSPQQDPPAPRSNTLRNRILLGCGCITAAVAIVCGALVGGVYLTREAMPAILWVFMASDDAPLGLGLDDAADTGVVCPNSQADAFTRAFQLRYPNSVTIELDDDTLISDDDNTVGVEGTFTYNGEAVPYEATFFIDPDGDGIYFFVGCIERIEQLEPPFIFEEPLSEGLSDRPDPTE